MGCAFEVAHCAEEGSYFLEVLLCFESFWQFEEGIQFEELLVGEGVVLIEGAEFLVGELHWVQELVDGDG